MKYKKSISYIDKKFDTGDIIRKNIEKYNVNKNSQFPPTDKKK